MNGKILKKLRLECDLTQEQLSKEIGVSPSTVRMIELGKREGSNEVVDKIADYFDVSLDYLNGRTDKRNIDEQRIDDFLNALIKDGIIKDPNNIDDETTDMIMNAVKAQLARKILRKKNK